MTRSSASRIAQRSTLRAQMTRLTLTLVAASTMAGATVGCESLPGNKEGQGAVIGGLGGAAAGALIGGEDNRLLGALIGGAAGAGGGYLVGANWDKITGDDKDDARRSAERAASEPATPEQARASNSADVNNDGFVTMDEIVAMDRADLGDREIIRRLRASGQYYELTADQEDRLRAQGVSSDVIVAMRDIGREDLARRQTDSPRNLDRNRDVDRDVLGTDRPRTPSGEASGRD